MHLDVDLEPGRSRRGLARGFTLIELMIVVVVIAVIAAIAIPNLLSARIGSNETAAIATLRELISAQSQFQARALADGDNDGIGEAGTFAELSAGVGVRFGSTVVTPAVLSSSFRSLNASGEVARSGYQYRVYLPGAGGTGLGEIGGGGAPGGIDPELAETTWCAYAWPTNYETTGVRTFFVNQGGEVIFAIEPSYDGPGNGPPAGAALRAGGNVASITGALATGTTGRDGRFWRIVGN
jgi:prepilin-type N-terminal cleavage/methylation domain-containing protein